jgi:SAM-dependent methyltransferase
MHKMNRGSMASPNRGSFPTCMILMASPIQKRLPTKWAKRSYYYWTVRSVALALGLTIILWLPMFGMFLDVTPRAMRATWETGSEAVFASLNKQERCQMEVKDNTSRHHPESKFFKKWLDGLHGIELAATTDNGFGLQTLNVDRSPDPESTPDQIESTGVYRRVDVISPWNQLPFSDSTMDFVLSSHGLQKYHDPIGLLCEAARVTKLGGYLALVIPRKERRDKDRDRERTTLEELIARHQTLPNKKVEDDGDRNLNAWVPKDVKELLRYMRLDVTAWEDVDDKAGDGFMILIQINNKIKIKGC